jgi:hypothetical protein
MPQRRKASRQCAADVASTDDADLHVRSWLRSGQIR